MPPRLFVDLPLAEGAVLGLPPGAARHVQVLRLQPGAPLTLFDGRGGEWAAAVLRIGRSEVEVRVDGRHDVDRELGVAVTLAVGMPANERMDGVVEKATELGAACVQPLVCERSVLRLDGERARKKVAHWQAVAVAASEQSGRTRVPVVAPVASLAAWLASLPPVDPAGDALRWLLSAPPARDGAAPPAGGRGGVASVVVLSGPEGGFAGAEADAARRHGFVPVSLGPRVLRADTAPIAALARLGAAFDAAAPARP